MGAQAVRLSNVDIDNALKNKEFEVLFQPIFDLGNGALARMETFVRWRHPLLGVLPPGAFISFFESQGRMSELTRYVLAGALGAYVGWRGPFAPGFSINLALSDLSDDAFVSHFAKLLRDHDFPSDLVTLECPMPAVDVDLQIAAAYFARLAETGARLAIEVRGRANDLLRNIDPFPFDEIKTGGSAILRFARTVRGPGLSAIADLLDIANNANAAITAVGVEDQASLAALRGLGFTAAQGNHMAKVGDLKEFRPGRVNEVRELLGLEPLSAESLTALFRTEAPTPSSATEDSTAATEPLDASADAAADMLKLSTPAHGEVDQVIAKSQSPEEAAKKAKAREKAKALALAKRAKAREARKNAAILRAKAKAARAKLDTPTNAAAIAETEESPFPPSHAPRDLLERLSQEFAAGDPETPEDMRLDAAGQAEEQTSVPEPEEASSDPIVKEEAAIPCGSEEKQHKEPEELSEEKPTAVSAQTEASLEKTSMSIAAAGAYFQPGIIVGSPGVRNSGPPSGALAQQPPQQDSTEAPLQALSETEPQPPHSSQDDVSGVPAEAPVEETSESSPSSEPPALNKLQPSDGDIIQGDLHYELDSDDTAPRRHKQRKNFLTRRYQLMPTHFWPKGWKRWYRRRSAKQTTSRTNLAAETAAAE